MVDSTNTIHAIDYIKDETRSIGSITRSDRRRDENPENLSLGLGGISLKGSRETKLPSPAHRFELYGWKPDPSLTEDELYLDIVFLITRSKQEDGRQGHMGSLIVRPSDTFSSSEVPFGPNDLSCKLCQPASATKENHDALPKQLNEKRFWEGILGAGTNTPLFDNNECTSDIHAEINALGEACKSKHSTEGCTAYITIPPCKRCFAALVSFGIRRIVTRQACPPIIRDTCLKRGITFRHLTQEEKRKQMQRINKLVNPHITDQELMEIAESVKQKRQARKKQTKREKHGLKLTVGSVEASAAVKTTRIVTSPSVLVLSMLVCLLSTILFVDPVLAQPHQPPDSYQHQHNHHHYQQDPSVYAKYQNQSHASSFKYIPFDISDSSAPVQISLSGLGAIQGVRSHNLGVDFFGGIPFAAPPVGNRRWAPPQEPPKWAPQILDASEYGTDCYQIIDPILNPLANPDTMSEDCLYLNIFTPAGASSANQQQLLPVMVWLHGGAFQQGSAARPEYNARRLAQEERVVVVTVNYRLGALGFLVSSELGLFGNYGLMDQRAALHFVKRRIQSFGGDPNSITLFGESAGAVMIGLHLQMENDGLFHKAILQSNPMGYQFRSVVVADFLGDALRRTVDCRDLECMRTEAVEEIMRAQSSLMGIPRSVGDFFAWGPTLTTAPTFTTGNNPSSFGSSMGGSSFSSFSKKRQWEQDRALFSVDRYNSHSRGGKYYPYNIRRESKNKFAVNVTQPLHNLNLVPDDIPIIIGTNKHEGEMFVHGAFPLTMSKAVYWMFVGALFKDSAPRVLKHYRPYVAQLEADAAALAEKQVAEEENKQYWTENKKDLENQYKEMLMTTSTNTRGGGHDDGHNDTLVYADVEDDDGTIHDQQKKEQWWKKIFVTKDPSEVEARKKQRLEHLKQKAKEKALKGAAKVSIDYRPVMSRIINDYLFRCPSWHYAHLLSLQRLKRNEHRRRNSVQQDNLNSVYVYRFSQPTHVPGYKECWGKSCHTAELPYVFESMDIIRSDYSTLSKVAQEEAPNPPEYPYTDLMAAYKGHLEEDDPAEENTKTQEEGSVDSSSSSDSLPLSGQPTSYFQQILRHFFDDYFLEDSDEETAHDIARRWVSFARTGNPNHDESNVEWIPWRFIPHEFDLEQDKASDEYLPWEKSDKELFNIWRNVEEKVMQDLEDNGGLRHEGEELEKHVEEAFRKRALEVLNMVVVEEDSLRTELKRNKSPTNSGENPFETLRLYLSRWNNTVNDSVQGKGDGGSDFRMIERIQRMAQDMGVMGRGLSGEYERLLGGGLNERLNGNVGISSHGYWEDDFFPQFMELQWPPEGRLVERDCTCDFWERIRYRY